MLQLDRRAFSRDMGYFLLALSPQPTPSIALRCTPGPQNVAFAWQFLSNFAVSLSQRICRGRRAGVTTAYPGRPKVSQGYPEPGHEPPSCPGAWYHVRQAGPSCSSLHPYIRARECLHRLDRALGSLVSLEMSLSMAGG